MQGAKEKERQQLCDYDQTARDFSTSNSNATTISQITLYETPILVESNWFIIIIVMIFLSFCSVFFFVHSKRTKANRVQIGCSFGKLFLSFILCHPPVVVVHLASLLISNKYVSAMNKILYVSEMKLACFALDNQPVKEAHRFHLFIRHFFIHLCYNCHVCVLSTQL